MISSKHESALPLHRLLKLTEIDCCHRLLSWHTPPATRRPKARPIGPTSSPRSQIRLRMS